MKKYLIVSGDSFTKGHELGEKGSWAYHTAKKMNLQLINLSENGMGNEWIASQLLSFLYRHEIILDECVVMIGWTDFARELSFYINDESQYIEQLTIVPCDLHGDLDDTHHPYFIERITSNRSVLKKFIGNEIVCLYKTYFSILHTRSLLEKYNIPFVFFDSVANNKLYYDKKIPYILSFNGNPIYLDFNNTDIPFLKDFKEKSFSDKIFDKKYINFENKSIYQWVWLDREKYEKGNPGHTNELAANTISDMIIKEYDKLYN